MFDSVLFSKFPTTMNTRVFMSSREFIKKNIFGIILGIKVYLKIIADDYNKERKLQLYIPAT